MLSYHFHGIHVLSGIPLGLPLVDHAEQIKPSYGSLTITQTTSRPLPKSEPIWVDPLCFKDGTPLARLYREVVPIMELTDAGFFYFVEDRIEMHLFDDAVPAPYLLGRLFGLWMELQGIPMLHGGCVSYAGEAFGFLADSGMGKSTLGASLFKKGFPLLTDDLIPLVIRDDKILVAPGIPMARVWPDTAEALIDDFHLSEKIHPLGRKRKVLHGVNGRSRFAESEAHLKALFLLERRPDIDAPSLDLVSGAQSLLALVSMSYRPKPLHVLGVHTSRLSKLAESLQYCQLYKLQYPSGFEHLDATCKLLTDTMGWPAVNQV